MGLLCGSIGGTADIIKEYADKTLNSRFLTTNFTFRWLSESDKGMYDAINKGIKMATGDVVGILNADDVLASDETLKRIAEAFESGGVLSGELKERRWIDEFCCFSFILEMLFGLLFCFLDSTQI